MTEVEVGEEITEADLPKRSNKSRACIVVGMAANLSFNKAWSCFCRRKRHTFTQPH